MTQNCPQCGKENPREARFCQYCGGTLTPASLLTQDAERLQTGPLLGTEAGKPATVSYPPPPVRQETLQAARPPDDIKQMGAGGFSVLDIWGPFAGYGDRGRHVSWLLDNLGERAEALRRAVTTRFQERQIPRALVQPKTLTGRGIAVERRDYHLVKRGVATEGLYIARFGQDLYISQVTYAKGPINPLRVLILLGMIAFQLYLIYGYGRSLSSAVPSFDLFQGLSGGSLDSLGTLLCCVGPLGILNTIGLLLVGLHMVYKFITDKDPFMLLRTPPNEFEYDDIVALEKAVEETVRQSLDRVGIDSALMPVAPEYGVKRRLI
jgi:hypothetical protein